MPTGQAQKEFFVNEAHALVDFLLHPAIEIESDAPPTNPEEGQCWLVGSNPTAEWASQSGNSAGWISGTWLSAAPQEGMRMFDKSTKQVIFFANCWQRLAAPAIPNGGQIADVEARAAIGDLVETLRNAGIVSSF